MGKLLSVIKATIGCAALLLAAMPGTTLATTQVSAVRVALAQDHTRIVLESNTPIRFNLVSLTNPDRLALDLEGVDLNAVLTELSGKVGAHHPYLKPVRIRQSGPDMVRLELDLKTEAEPRIFTLKPEGEHGFRLVLDIYPAQPVGPALARQQQMPPTEPVAEPVPAGPPPTPDRQIAQQKPAAPAPDAVKAQQPVVAVAPPPETAKQAAVEAVAGEEVWLAVRINQQELAETALLLRRNDGRLLVRGEDLQRWRLRLPDVAPRSHGGEAYYPLDALRGLSYQMDESSQALVVDAAPGLFVATALKGAAAGFTVPTAAPPGGFLNYDVFANHAQGQTKTSGLLELGGFGGWGAGVSSFLARDLGGDTPFIRLDTTWTHDRPAELASLRLGDAISEAGDWGRSVRFGGVQWATNFATQPGFIAFPLPGLSGEAVLPSTVDLYVNDALRMRREVPAGPFSIQDLPVVTGQGEARLVVRDLLGRERIITQPYYASPRLLQQGLHDYSYELGLVRENFGIAGNDYGRPLAVGTHRLGFSDRFTGEARGELLGDQQTMGLGGAFLWPAAGVFTAALAASRGYHGAGGLLGLGFARQSSGLSFGANTQLTSERFVQLGLQPGEPAPRQVSQAFVSLPTSGYGSVGLAYTHQGFRDREEIKLLSASYSVSLGKAGFLSVSMLRFLSGDAKTAIGLTLTLPLDARTSASVSATAQPGSEQALLQVQRNLPAGSGVGYRLLAGAGDSDRREAGVSAQNELGTYSLETAQSHGETGVRASASGGVAWLGGSAFLSRRITDSFAVVQVPDYPNVRIYADNQPIATTGSDGSALVPRLRPYEKNSVRIEQADLPLDAQIDAVQIDAVPYFRSGLLLQFPVKRSRGALLTVVLENGEPLPAGAVAQIVGEKNEFPAGLRGEVYLTGLAASNRLRVTWRGQSCAFTVPFPDTPEPLPHLGTYTCTGVKP